MISNYKIFTVPCHRYLVFLNLFYAMSNGSSYFINLRLFIEVQKSRNNFDARTNRIRIMGFVGMYSDHKTAIIHAVGGSDPIPSFLKTTILKQNSHHFSKFQTYKNVTLDIFWKKIPLKTEQTTSQLSFMFLVFLFYKISCRWRKLSLHQDVTSLKEQLKFN